MAPSCRRSTFWDINSSDNNAWLSALWIYQKGSHVKYMHLVKMSIFAVTSSKAYNLWIIQRIDCVKPFSCVKILELNVGLIPDFCFQIKGPKVFLIWISFSSYCNHVILMKTWSMISASTGDRGKFFEDYLFNIHCVWVLPRIQKRALFSNVWINLHKSKSYHIVEPSFLCLTSTEYVYSKLIDALLELIFLRFMRTIVHSSMVWTT